MKQVGISAQFYAVFVAPSYAGEKQSANRALQMVDAIRHDMIERYPNDFMLALNTVDIQTAKKQNKIGVVLAIEVNLRPLNQFYNLGVRSMSITHNNSNELGDAATDIEQPNHGLSPLGKQAVAEMNRLGMSIDVSHVSDQTTLDAIAACQAPIIASHSNCRAVSNVPRNRTDAMIQAMATKGGVINRTIDCGFMNRDIAEALRPLTPRINRRVDELLKLPAYAGKARREVMEETARAMSAPRATIDDVVSHMDHVVRVAGIDYVGIGTSYDGPFCIPKELDDVSEFSNLTRSLLEHGYSKTQILKIYGGNTLRMMREVEAVAQRLQRGVGA